MNYSKNYASDQLYSILSNCDKDQLNKYLNDEEATDLLVKSFEQYQELVREKERLEAANRELAEKNLNMEPALQSYKYKLKQSLGDFETLKREYLSLKEAYEIHAGLGSGSSDAPQQSLQAISGALQARATRAEEDSDKQADEFFCTQDGTPPHSDEELNAFQRQFLEARAAAHVKKIKAEKMKELLAARSYY